MVIKSRLRTARLSQHLTQSQLAKLVGVSSNAISSYETGKILPSLPVAIKLCLVFDCIMEWLFYLDYSSAPSLPWEDDEEAADE